MIKLSIIVPVYNVAPYLAKCLDSLLCQDLEAEEYEIVLVYDESIDHSLKIAKNYATTYSQIRLIIDTKKSLGGARNTGIENARGIYIWFVDSDDYVRTNSLGQLLDKMSKLNLDALRLNYYSVDGFGQIMSKGVSYNVDYSSQVVDGRTFLVDRLGYACYSVMYILRTKLLRDNNLYFYEKIYFEDVEWLPRVLINIRRITSHSIPVYYYLQRSDSMTHNKSLKEVRKLVDDKLLVIDRLNQICIEQSSLKVQKWFKGMISFSVQTLLSSISYTLPKDEVRRYIYCLKVKNVFPLIYYQVNMRKKMNIFIINISPWLYCFLKRVRFKR